MTRLLAIVGAIILPQSLAALEFSAATYRVSERSGIAVLTVTRAAGSSGAATVAFSTTANSASPGLDYTPASGILQWQNGDAAGKVIEIQILQDAFEEEPQDFFVTLSDATGETIGPNNTAQVIIENPGARFEELYTSAFAAPAQLDLLVSVTGLTATRVEFLEGDTVLGTNANPRPDGFFPFTWTNIPRGAYTIRARAFDAVGLSVTSSSRTILISGAIAGANLSTVHVDQSNLTGLENGTPANPFVTIQKGIDNATNGAVVKVASGTYRESILIDNKSLQILGGYARAGNFSTRDTLRQRVNVQPTGRRAGFGLYNAQDTQIDGFTVSGAAHGFFIVGDAIEQSFPKLRHNLITANGEAFRAHGGGGVHAQTSNLELTENEITFNQGGRGGGVSAGGPQAAVVIKQNIIRGNIGHDDHGGGLYIMANGVIAGNLIQNNEVGKAVDYGGWGGGLILFGNSSDFFPQMTLSNNIVTGNYAINGSAEFFDEGARASLDHELIYGNRTTPNGGGGAVYVDGCCNTSVTLNHCTVADNEGYRTGGNGLYVDPVASASVTNSIFWNNGPEFAALGDATLQISYTLSDDAISTGDGIIAGPGNIQSDPLFADAPGNDYRLKSTRGRWSPGAGSRIQDTMNSPAIDAADPAADFSWETLPAGGRADLGFYGNRSEVNLSAAIAGNQVRIVANGANGRPYRLERSDNFETWSEIATLTGNSAGQMDYMDAVAAGARFYRFRQ